MQFGTFFMTKVKKNFVSTTNRELKQRRHKKKTIGLMIKATALHMHHAF